MAPDSKDGKYGCGPVTNSDEIITTLITSMRAHRNFATDVSCNISDALYLIPWRDDWNKYSEFRVFVNERKVTCLSQYIWHTAVGWNRKSIEIVAPRIIDFCNNIARDFYLSSFVIDAIVVVKDPKYNNDMLIPIIDSATEFDIELVEFNSFGAELSTSSALFHWLNDYDVMYESDEVVVRYTSNVDN